MVLEEPPPWPEHWVLREGLYATVGGDPADQAVVRRISRHVEEAVPRIAKQLGVPTGRTLRVYVAHSQDQFSAIQPGTPPSYADATAYPLRALVFLRAPRLRPGMAKPLEQVTDHEITHVLLEQRFHGEPVPRWLHEGLAQYVAKEYSEETTRALSRGVLGDSLYSLDYLVTGFPDDPLRAQLAYAQSADLVAFLRNEHGEDDLRELVRQLAIGTPVRAAFREATGQSMDEVDQAWRSRLQKSHLWFPPLVSDSMWFAVGGLVLFVGWLRVRRRNRERRAWMEREEALERELEALWQQHLGPRPEPEDPPWGTPPGLRSRDTDGWATTPPARRLRGWLPDERVAEGLSADSEESPWDHPVPPHED